MLVATFHQRVSQGIKPLQQLQLMTVMTYSGLVPLEIRCFLCEIARGGLNRFRFLDQKSMFLTPFYDELIALFKRPDVLGNVVIFSDKFIYKTLTRNI